MNKLMIATVFAIAVPAAAFAGEDTASVRSEAASPAQISAGKMLYAGGNRVAPVYRVTSDGNAQIVLNGKLVTVPASTLSNVGGKLTTSLSKADLDKSR